VASYRRGEDTDPGQQYTVPPTSTRPASATQKQETIWLKYGPAGASAPVGADRQGGRGQRRLLALRRGEGRLRGKVGSYRRAGQGHRFAKNWADDLKAEYAANGRGGSADRLGSASRQLLPALGGTGRPSPWTRAEVTAYVVARQKGAGRRNANRSNRGAGRPESGDPSPWPCGLKKADPPAPPSRCSARTNVRQGFLSRDGAPAPRRSWPPVPEEDSGQ